MPRLDTPLPLHCYQPTGRGKEVGVGGWVGGAEERVYRGATKTPAMRQTKEACRARNAGSSSKNTLGITVAVNYAEGPIVGSSPPFLFKIAERFKESLRSRSCGALGFFFPSPTLHPHPPSQPARVTATTGTPQKWAYLNTQRPQP